MEISAALTADLNALTAALDQPHSNIHALLGELLEDLHVAVESFLGLTVTIIVDYYPVTFTAISDTDHTRIGASAMLPLSTLTSTGPGGVIVIYAVNPGAFVDLAADLSHALKLEADTVVLDQHLTPPEQHNALAEMSQINQAIGILLDRGRTPAAARLELDGLAHHAASTLHTAARLLIASITAPLPRTAGGA